MEVVAKGTQQHPHHAQLAAALGAVMSASILLLSNSPPTANHDNDGVETRVVVHQDKKKQQFAYIMNDLYRVPTILKHNVTSCDFAGSLAPMYRLSRTRTIKNMEDARSKETLRSKYKVKWRKPLGEGGFGAVYMASDKKSKEQYAVKKIAKKCTDDDAFQREMNVFLHIRKKGGHPNICGLREHFDEGDCYFLVLDLICGGELFDHLIRNGAYSEADAARLLREVGSALAFLHGINVVHGDLKPENLMLSSENPLSAVIKLVDFGSAHITDKESPYYEGTITEVTAHTPGYAPPEVVDKQRKRANLCPSVDMFAVGVILYVMLCGAHPFDLEGNATNEELNERVLSKHGPPLRNSPITSHLSDSAIDLIEKLLHPNPNKRLTAQQMLNHPWVRGETARTGKMAGSHERLTSYRKYKSKLEAKVFQSMVGFSDSANGADISKKTSLIEQSFQVLDRGNKGYITTNELKRLNGNDDGDNTDIALPEDDSQLGLSEFSALLSENMKNRYYPAGHVVYREGDKGKKMYFINSGRIEVSTKDGFKTNREQGDFFGEGALLSKSGRRSATIKCVTPVHAIEISKEYFEKYLVDGYDTQLSLREKNWERRCGRAKAILSSAKNLNEVTYSKGAYFFKQGEPGDELFILESGEAEVNVDSHAVSSRKPGEFLGEHAVVFGKPRNASAKCVSKQCVAHVMKAADLDKFMRGSSVLKETLRELTLRGEFRKALVFATKKDFPKNEAELRRAFDIADYSRSGSIDRSDISVMLRNMDKSFTEKDVEDILNTLDLDGNGSVGWEEFKRIFGMSTH